MRQVAEYSTIAFDRAPFIAVRDDLRDLVSIPVQTLLRSPGARKRSDAYQALYAIPLDLATAGFTVTLKETGSGWAVEVEKTIVKGSKLHLHAEARSLISTFYQLADMGTIAIDDLEKAAKRRWREAQAEKEAA